MPAARATPSASSRESGRAWDRGPPSSTRKGRASPKTPRSRARPSRTSSAPARLPAGAPTGPGQQEELVRAVLATGTPSVLVLTHGRPLSIPGLVARGPAILDGWYLGQE